MVLFICFAERSHQLCKAMPLLFCSTIMSSAQTPRSTSVTPRRVPHSFAVFKRQSSIKGVIGLDTLLDQLQQGKEPADNAVVITFDDGLTTSTPSGPSDFAAVWFPLHCVI